MLLFQNRPEGEFSKPPVQEMKSSVLIMLSVRPLQMCYRQFMLRDSKNPFNDGVPCRAESDPAALSFLFHLKNQLSGCPQLQQSVSSTDDRHNKVSGLWF